MLTREFSIKYAQNFVDRIRKKGINLKIVKLFGSYSKNSQKEDSDIDLLLVSDKFVGVGFIDFQLIADELIDFDLIQAKTYSTEDYEEGDPFLEEIEKTSILIN